MFGRQGVDASKRSFATAVRWATMGVHCEVQTKTHPAGFGDVRGGSKVQLRCVHEESPPCCERWKFSDRFPSWNT